MHLIRTIGASLPIVVAYISLARLMHGIVCAPTKVGYLNAPFSKAQFSNEGQNNE